MSEMIVACSSLATAEEFTVAVDGVIAAAASARLCQAPYLELRHVNCNVERGVLSLQGHVSSYYLRQMAQTLIKGLEGVEAINNQLEVIPGRLPRNRHLLKG